MLVKFYHSLLVQLKVYLILIVQYLYYFLFHDLIFCNDCELQQIKFLLQISDLLHNHLEHYKFLLVMELHPGVLLKRTFVFLFNNIHTKLYTFITNKNCWTCNKFSYFMLAFFHRRNNIKYFCYFFLTYQNQ